MTGFLSLLCEQGKAGANGEKGRPGTPGEQGQQGIPGPQGPKGASGKTVSLTTAVRNATFQCTDIKWLQDALLSPPSSGLPRIGWGEGRDWRQGP